MKIKLLFLPLLIFVILSCHNPKQHQNIKELNIAGKWSFRKDAQNRGLKEKWNDIDLDEEVSLPGSMSTNGKGDDVTLKTKWVGSIFDSTYFFKPEFSKYRIKGHIKIPFGLQPNKHYVGAAWYQKDINIPVGWEGKRLKLVLERPHWQTMVWLDDQSIGHENSLSTPHVFVIANNFPAGKHKLTIRIDNGTTRIDPGQNSHSISDHTQTNWNGIVGKMYIKPLEDVSIHSIRLYPNHRTKKVKVVLILDSVAGPLNEVRFRLQANAVGGSDQRLPAFEWKQQVHPNNLKVVKEYDMGKDAKLWDEFSPNLYSLKVSLTTPGSPPDIQSVNFGFRDVQTRGRTLLINNHKVFLRGAIDCAIFPLTGYPPTDQQSWDKIFKTLRSYGLNHLRFHSWCPAEAAFDAADAAGFYLQIECASWANWGSSLGDGKPIDQYIYNESEKIITSYGNHPSFVMLTYGNEAKRTTNMVPYLSKLVSFWKGYDNRRIYTSGAGRPVVPENDYENIPEPRIQHAPVGLKSFINGSSPSTAFDWTEIIDTYNKPVVAHEMGQWCAYPDLKEVKQYTGILKANNFEIFADRLKENGLSLLADSFLLSSGKLQVLCYKSDIEAALRTPQMGGFQLLGLQDFPGQGSAIVGVVNAFWKDKGYVNGKEVSKFCSPVVPLARFGKLNVLNNESLNIPVQVSNFGKSILKHATVKWRMTGLDGKVLFNGKFIGRNIQMGELNNIGTIKQSLISIRQAQKVKLSIVVGEYENTWDFFIYPAKLPVLPADVLVTNILDSKAKNILKDGGNVLLTFKKGSIAASKGGKIAVGFSTIFWNTAWSNGAPPHTLGLLCNPNHPALAAFPADFHSNWQWWDAMSHSDAIILDSVATNLKPVVRVIDDWVSARSLGIIFEVRVGRGKLLVSGIDLLTDAKKRPEARQLLYSLTKYMNSRNFKPVSSVSISKIEHLLE